MKTLLLVLVSVLAAVAAGSAHGAIRDCGTLAFGKNTKGPHPTAGASCLLQAFQHCRSATYSVERLSVDATVSVNFTVARLGKKCLVPVRATVGIYPDKPHKLNGTCVAVKRVKNDIQAVGCSSALPKSISLTGGLK